MSVGHKHFCLLDLRLLFLAKCPKRSIEQTTSVLLNDNLVDSFVIRSVLMAGLVFGGLSTIASGQAKPSQAEPSQAQKGGSPRYAAQPGLGGMFRFFILLFSAEVESS